VEHRLCHDALQLHQVSLLAHLLLVLGELGMGDGILTHVLRTVEHLL